MKTSYPVKTKEIYSRNAPVYNVLSRLMMTDYLKGKVWEMVRGEKILEVGIGTGESFPYYPENSRVTGIDFSPGMLAIAKKRAVKNPKNIDLRLMDIMDLKFEDNYFDSVVSIFVFCSVPRPVRGLKELNRVCKSDGHIYFLEHVRSENRIIGKFMDYINPLAVRMTGANINRETVKNIQRAGLKIEKIETHFFNIVKIIKARAK
ncbi:MAG: class I SAM-dependent methyltransferase [Elusimicrobiota bacterium]